MKFSVFRPSPAAKIILPAAFILLSAARCLAAPSADVKKSSAARAAPESNQPVEISADIVEYDTVGHIARASGNVVIMQGGTKLESDEAEVFIDRNLIYAGGNAKLTREGAAVFFSTGSFGSSDETGLMSDARGFAGSWTFTARRLKRDGLKFHGSGATYTNCAHPKPHYRIHSSRLTIVPRRFVSTTNAFFFVGSVPVFWLPYWWHSLGDGPLNVAVEPGYNNKDGFDAKIRASYNYSDYARTVFLADYYGKRGNGFGVDSTHSFSKKHKSAVYAYRIREETTGVDRWSAQAYMWQSISEDWSARSEIKYSSDESFNESYFTESWNPVQREVNSNLFFARQSTVSYLNIGVQRRQVYDPETASYLNARTEAPSVAYTRYRMERILGFYPQYTLGYQKLSIGHEAPYLSILSANASAASQKKIGKSIVLSPVFGINEAYTEQSSNTYILSGSYYAGSGMRWYWPRAAFLDLNYGYAQRFLPDTFIVDKNGIERNDLTTALYTFPVSGLFWKISGGFDFLRETPKQLSNEINIFGGKHSFFLNVNHDWATKEYRNALAVWSYGETAAMNVYHNTASADILGVGAELNAPLDKKTAVSIQLIGNLEEGRFMPLSRQIKLDRDLHCWNLWLLYRRRESLLREPVDEFFFKFSMKMGEISAVRRLEIEKEVYPWRK